MVGERGALVATAGVPPPSGRATLFAAAPLSSVGGGGCVGRAQRRPPAPRHRRVVITQLV